MLGTSTSALALSLGSVVLGCGIGLLHVVNMTRLARIGARLGRGKIAGLHALTGPSGSVTASLAGGLLGRQIGLQSVFLLFIPVVALLLWQLHQERVAVAV